MTIRMKVKFLTLTVSQRHASQLQKYVSISIEHFFCIYYNCQPFRSWDRCRWDATSVKNFTFSIIVIDTYGTILALTISCLAIRVSLEWFGQYIRALSSCPWKMLQCVLATKSWWKLIKMVGWMLAIYKGFESNSSEAVFLVMCDPSIMSCEQPRQVYAQISMGLACSQLIHTRVAHD